MQLSSSNIILRFRALIRFLTIKVFYFKKIKIKNLSYLGKGIKLITSNRGSIIINGKIRIIDHVELQSDGEIIIGDGGGINSFSRIIAFERIVIGNRVSIAQFVSILDHDHSFALEEGRIDLKKFSTSPIEIGNDVWIGDKVTITKGVKIGDNVVIGANSVVTKDIPSNSLAVGIPAKVIRTLG
jgi:acetyltransferase-like isoleucine patch superfamily enzyme